MSSNSTATSKLQRQRTYGSLPKSTTPHATAASFTAFEKLERRSPQQQWRIARAQIVLSTVGLGQSRDDLQGRLQAPFVPSMPRMRSDLTG